MGESRSMSESTAPDVSLSIAVCSSINPIFANTNEGTGNASEATNPTTLFTITASSSKVVVVNVVTVLQTHSISPSARICRIITKTINTCIRRTLKLWQVQLISRTKIDRRIHTAGRYWRIKCQTQTCYTRASIQTSANVSTSCVTERVLLIKQRRRG
eukprot:Gb_30353 [translate_table: standard]